MRPSPDEFNSFRAGEPATELKGASTFEFAEFRATEPSPMLMGLAYPTPPPRNAAINHQNPAFV